MSNEIKNEESPVYISPLPPAVEIQKSVDDAVIERALIILNSRLKKTDLKVDGIESVKKYLKLKFMDLEHEVFGCLFLNNRHHLIAYEELFRGTVDGASVYPREVVKRALQLNAAALIITHNHPSGEPEPSQADKRITLRLNDALDTVDIRLLDHVIVGDAETVSLAERGVI